MAYALTYAALVSELQTYVDNTNTEFVGQLPNIIARAQDRVQADLSMTQWREIEHNSVTANVSTYPRQASWLKVFSLFFPASGRFAERRSMDWCRMMNATAAKGVPRYYAEHQDGSMLLSPTPAGNYEVYVDTLVRLPALSATNPSNWISTNAASCLLYAALIECEGFLIDADRKAEFLQMYTDNLQRTRSELTSLDREEYGTVRDAAKTTGGAA